MPELPEVQATVDGLHHRVIGRKIINLWTDWPKMFKDPLDQRRIRHNHVRFFKNYLCGEKILSIRRRAKNILIYLTHEKMMLIHQKMSGHLLVGRWQLENSKVVPLGPTVMKNDPWNGYIRALFYLNAPFMIAFSDLRRFGKVVIGKRAEIESLSELADLGPEPFDAALTLERFSDIIQRERRTIKQVLMDPYVIAGIGNIYSDDILWTAKVYPLRKANLLQPKELGLIYRAMKSVLKKAIRLKGTSAGDYRTPEGVEGKYARVRRVYRRTDEPCSRCRAKIVRLKIGGRSAHFCPKCQRK